MAATKKDPGGSGEKSPAAARADDDPKAKALAEAKRQREQIAGALVRSAVGVPPRYARTKATEVTEPRPKDRAPGSYRVSLYAYAAQSQSEFLDDQVLLHSWFVRTDLSSVLSAEGDVPLARRYPGDKS